MQLAKKLLVGSALIFLALPLAGSLSNASAQNALVNAGFETGDLTGWTVNGVTANSTVTVESPDNGPTAPGSFHVLMDNQVDGLGMTLKQSTLPGTAGPGEVFYSFDLKLVEAAAGGVFFVEIFAEGDGLGVLGGSGILGNYTPADWTTFTGSFIAPANTDFLTIQFGAITGANIGSVSSMRVDHVRLTQGSIPTETSNWGELKSDYR